MAIDFNTLVDRAERRTKGKQRPDFVMTVEGDEEIRIKYPDSIVAMNYERATTVYDQLQILAGKDFARIIGLVQGKPIAVVQNIITEMWEQWDANDAEAVPGGKEG